MDDNEVKSVFDMSGYFVPHAVEDPWQTLADAVVWQAAKDYRSALRGVGIGRNRGQKVAKECEWFFHSTWFTTLSTLDGNTLIRKLSAMQEDVYDENRIGMCC